jgi:hypothetical protein
MCTLCNGVKDSIRLTYHIVIGQQVYDALDDGQKSMHKHLKINSDVWNYVSSSTGENIYKACTDK